MSEMVQETQSKPQENKPIDKETNFRLQEKAIQDKYERILAQERAARIEAEKRAQELAKKPVVEEDEDDEPYVDKRKLNKKLAQFGEQTLQQTQSEIQKAVQIALKDERKNNWIKNNPDFYEILQHADKFAAKDPELAESILEMPEGFERQKLVYKNIKALGLHNPETKQVSIQEKIDSNRRGPYYQPSGVGTAPYSTQGDFSKSGQKQAYNKLQELKSRK